MGSTTNALSENAAPHHLSVLDVRCYPKHPTYWLQLRQPSLSWSTLLRHPSIQHLYVGTGILTCFPSPTALALGLGPGLPWEDCPRPGNLGFSANGILTRFHATRVGIISSIPSNSPHGLPSADIQCSPTARTYVLTHSFGV